MYRPTPAASVSIALLTSLVLAACGGPGSGTPASPPIATVTTTTQIVQTAIVMEQPIEPAPTTEALITQTLLPHIPTNTTDSQVQDTTTGQKNYVSPDLGISFTYLDTCASPCFSVKEIGDKVYIYPSQTQPQAGQYVQVFQKEKGDSLVQAIEKRFLGGYSKEDCLVRDTSRQSGIGNRKYPDQFVTANIIVPTTPNDDLESILKKAEKCPATYTRTNGIAYFLEDTTRPDRFLFLSIGHYPIMADDNKTWQETIQILK